MAVQQLSQRRAGGVLNWAAVRCPFPDVMNPSFPFPPAHCESQRQSSLSVFYLDFLDNPLKQYLGTMP